MASDIWQDMLFLEELNSEMASPLGPGESEEETGFKQYVRDPKWLTWLSFVLLALVIAAFWYIIWGSR